MDLEKIEFRKKFFKNSGFCNSKSPSFYYIVIPIFSKPFTGRIELLTIPWMKRCFERNVAAKDFHFKQKKSIWKKK